MSYRLRVNPVACEAHGACADLLPERITTDPWGYPIIAPQPVPTTCSHMPGAPPPAPR